MEGLHVAMEDAMAVGLYNGFSINNLSLSHLFFADDAIFIGEWSSNNIKSLVAILDCFHKVSGLKINFQKSNLFEVWVSPDEVSSLAAITGCNPLVSPFIYLGLPIDCNMARIKSWDLIVEKFSNRLSNWRASILSIGGVWSRIVGSINRIHEKNLIPLSSMKRQVNNGASTKFWYDSWAGTSPFKSLFPRLFQLAVNNDCLVRDIWNNGWSFDWVHNISSGSNASQLDSLQNSISSITLNDSEDNWVWSLGGHSFTVRSARCQIDWGYLPDQGPGTRWIKIIPKKINIFVWRALRDRLPTRWNLSRRDGILLDVMLNPSLGTIGFKTL
nr:RNA-directed DNA polymerase, eukaryota [Tanacetum cinerariifolium]